MITSDSIKISQTAGIVAGEVLLLASIDGVVRQTLSGEAAKDPQCIKDAKAEMKHVVLRAVYGDARLALGRAARELSDQFGPSCLVSLQPLFNLLNPSVEA